MSIRTVRRISQVFFLLLFLWFCVAMNLGDRWWQLRGWPVNWFLHLDPLAALATVLTTGVLYAGLLWSVVSLVLTLLLGRFFCGWLCPLGTLQQGIGWLGQRHRTRQRQLEKNRPHRAQCVKYVLLTVLLSAASVELLRAALRAPWEHTTIFVPAAAAGVLMALAAAGRSGGRKTAVGILLATVVLWAALGAVVPSGALVAGSLHTGLLDPIPLAYRSVNLVLLPAADHQLQTLSPVPRYYAGAALIGMLFASILLFSLWIPRLYCRFLCPLGALFGVVGRYAVWRIGKTGGACTDCRQCDRFCEGACDPAGRIRQGECVLCVNCLSGCRQAEMGYRTSVSQGGEILSPDLSRRGFLLSLAAGASAIPMLRLDGSLAANWPADKVRPPGALIEPEFLRRCIQCGQCMRICPTNVLQPAGPSFGLESLWTPVLNFRIGSSGCQFHCIACGHLCPTGAIRPLELDERIGRGEYARKGPIRIGTAFVDRGRCLPWSMDRPCIVCQENCPVSPKAITTIEDFQTAIGGDLTLLSADPTVLEFPPGSLETGRFATGDFRVRVTGPAGSRLRTIVSNTDRFVQITESDPLDPVPAAGTVVQILIRLQKPVVEPHRCIGCGVCEHECPVKGLRAIRITAENESRNAAHGLLLS